MSQIEVRIHQVPRPVFQAAIERGIAKMTREAREKYAPILRLRGFTAPRSAIGFSSGETYERADNLDRCPLRACGLDYEKLGEDFSEFAAAFDNYLTERLDINHLFTLGVLNVAVVEG